MKSASLLRMCVLCGLVLSACLLPAVLVAQDDAVIWSNERYGVLSAVMEDADEAILHHAPGSPEWNSARESALQARRELLAFVSGALRSGTIPADLVEDATRARYLLIQNVIAMSAELGQCEGLPATLRLLEPLSQSDDPELHLAWERAVGFVEECEPAVVDAPPAPDSSSEQSAEASGAPMSAEWLTVPGEARRRPGAGGIAGRVLVGVGGAAFAGGWIWDAFSGTGPRSEFSLLYGLCSAGSADCDPDRLRLLKTRIDNSRAPIATLVGAGAALAATGATLWIIEASERRRNEPEVRLGAGGAGALLGANVSVRW